MGRATTRDVLHVLGKPYYMGLAAGEFENDPDRLFVYQYDHGGTFPGNLSVYVSHRRGRVVLIVEQFTDLPLGEAVGHYGPEFRETHYELCPDWDDEESVPEYESDHGQLALEYRAQGIVLLVQGGRVFDAYYVDKALALASEQACATELLKYRQKVKKLAEQEGNRQP